MSEDSILKRNWVKGSAVLATAALSLVLAAPVQAAPLAKVKSATQGATENVVEVTFQGGDGADVKGRITFLEEGVFRYNVDPTGTFDEYAVPTNSSHTAHIQAQPDSDKDAYSHPKATVETSGGSILIKSGKTTITLDKETAKMKVSVGDREVLSEASPIDLSSSSTVQTLDTDAKEFFFGGGTQNGRFTHKGKTIKIANTNNWVDGGVASPNPFYWSSDGYGVLRNTFKPGAYDFGEADASQVKLSHEENEFDAYYFLSDGASRAAVAQDVLDGYFDVTGDPVLLPEYAFYLGHLNAYNRDGWSKTGGGTKWETKYGKPAGEAGEVKYEKGYNANDNRPDGSMASESLNGHGPSFEADGFKPKEFSDEFSAQQVIRDYEKADMPLGWFLPNDGYGAGYGQNGYGKTENNEAERNKAIDANVQNLREFTDYANARGVETGLWTQSNLEPVDNEQWHLQRDFKKEVEQGGISALKTDVAWVGSGYSFGLNGIKKAYDVATNDKFADRMRPNIVTLDGWAGTQRYGGIWTGDQTGGNWEYIRFHLPTYIGQGLSGNPNVGSDMDGIFGGAPIIATRDYQWKTFTPTMLDMDGWGAHRKSPMTHGDPYTGISRMYLKLKAQLMPYIYTSAASAANIDTKNGDTGLPMVRAMMLTDDSEFASGTDTQYQYTFGKYFLVAPVYQNTADAGNTGNDVRNGIYLPNYNKTKDGAVDEQNPTIWIDYFTGKQYRGGQVLNNFEAPLWKLPLFVQAGAIVPMYEENNNPQAISETNKKGLDKTRRIVEFWPAGNSEYTLFEDDGKTINSNQKDVEGYGVVENVNYGDHVSTKITSKVEGDTATLTIGKSEGGYTGYNSERSTTAVVNVTAAPTSITYGGQQVEKVNDKAAFDKAKNAGKGTNAVWYYEQAPDLNTTPESEEFGEQEITTTPKVYVFLPKTDVKQHEQVLVVKGFANDPKLGGNTLQQDLKAPAKLESAEENKTPTSIKLTWDKVDGATGYELLIDGSLNAVGDVVEFNHTGLPYHSTHTYQIRSRNEKGFSAWSEKITSTSLEDPWRNTLAPAKSGNKLAVDWSGGDDWGALSFAFDHDKKTMFHSGDIPGLNVPMTIDYGMVYELEDFVYVPRENAGNGNISRMKIETSVDGQHWTEPIETNWTTDNSEKTVELKGRSARYLRLTPLAGRSDHFSANELMLNKKDGSAGKPLGSLVGKETVCDEDYVHLKGNALGIEQGDASWDSHVAGRGADFNMNGAYDAYDISITMSKLNGGTKKTDKVSGGIALIPNKSEVKRGEVVTFDVYADDARAVNALGVLVHYDTAKFKVVDGSVAQGAGTFGMKNLNTVKRPGSVNLTLANKGDQDLYSGSGSVLTFQLEALQDGPVELKDATGWLVGPQGDFVESDLLAKGELPEAPQTSVHELGQQDFDISITNKALAEDNGSNVSQMIQGGKFDPLFDGVENHDGVQGAGCFELKWSTTTDVVSIDGMKISFKLKEPRALKDVELVNRRDSKGEVNGNGFVKKVAATITFEDGTQEFGGGEYDTVRAKYVFAPSAENANKKVKQVDIKPLEANNGPHMLTISEVNFHYEKAGVTADAIELGENQTSLHVGDLAPVKAKVLPQDDRYPYFTVESGKPTVASVVSRTDAAGRQTWYVRGESEGTAKITVKAAADPSKTAEYEVTVKAGADTKPLEDAIAEATMFSADAYTPESYAQLDQAVKEARALLNGNPSKSQILAAANKVEKAISALKMRPVDKNALINTKENKDAVKVAFATSAASEHPMEFALDYDDASTWHSDYSGAYKLPQGLIFDLGAEYDLTDVTFLARHDDGTNGDVFEAQVYVGSSVDELKDGGTLVGTFKFDNNGKVLNNRDEFKQMAFGARRTQFVKVLATHAGGEKADAYASMAEVRFYGAKPTVPGKVDVSKLEKLVADIDAEKLVAEDYTQSTWEPFANALHDAKELLKNPGDDQKVVDELAERLSNARKALVKSDVAPQEKPDKSALEALVAEAGKLDTEGKTPALVERLNAAIAGANAVLGDDAATDEQVKAAFDELKAAIDALKGDAGSEGNNGSDSNGGSDNNGGSNNGTTGNGSTGGQGSGNGTAGGQGGSNASGLPQTGDPATVAVATTGISGAIAAFFGAFRRRKDK